MTQNLLFYAGATALALIREKGLRPEDVKIMTGAAGGPKWLVLGHLDRYLFTEWFRGRTDPLFLIGSSSGAWRFAAACQRDMAAAVDRFRHAYIHQFYHREPTAAEVSAEGGRILDALLGDDGEAEILTHPYLRLNIMAVRSLGIAALEGRFALGLGLAGAAACNLIHRRGLKPFFQRALFHDPRDRPPFYRMGPFGIRQVPLDKRNLRAAMLASGSIPLVMSGVRGIPGAPPGVYRDGGVIDYHMDIPPGIDRGVVLFPHYLGRVIPGWLDKRLSWRRPENMDRVLLVAPSPEFVARLPHGRIPDRTDFHRFMGRDGERVASWNRAVDLSRCLADEFNDAVATGAVRERIRPFPGLRSSPGRRRVGKSRPGLTAGGDPDTVGGDCEMKGTG